MQFDKPKVTIDLEEYQHLKDRVAGMDTDEMVLTAKEVIAALMYKHPGMSYVSDFLEKKGILFFVTPRSRPFNVGDFLKPDEINISKIKPKNER